MENSKALTVKVTTVYGNEAIYPVCEDSKAFCCLLNKKTLSRRDISIIKTLGYSINQEQPAAL